MANVSPIVYAFHATTFGVSGAHESEVANLPPVWRLRFGIDQEPAACRLPPARRNPPPGKGLQFVATFEASGPGAGPWLLVAPGGMDYERDRCEYRPAEQCWTELEDGIWLGLADTATSMDFVRSRLVPSPSVAGAADYDGIATTRGLWLIPVARVDSPDCQLPMVEAYRKGEWTHAPEQPYRNLAADALRAWQAERGELTLSRAERRDIAIRALQCNYALTGPELAAYDVLADAAYDVILSIITDANARKKKALSDAPSTDSGAPAV